MYNKLKSAMECEGYTLLTSIDNFSNKSKIDYVCPLGHHHTIKDYSVFTSNKRRCPLCAKLKSMTPYIHIYNTLKSYGCELIYPEEKNYVSFKIKKEKLKYICSNGHTVETSWSNIRRKGYHCCVECFKLNKRIPYNDIVSTFDDKNYKVISPTEDEYTAAYKQKIEYICPNGHQHSIRYSDFLNGHGCPECAGLLRHDYENVKKSFDKERYTLISKEYNNNKQKLEYICPNGHQHSIRYDDWKRGVRCGICDMSKVSNVENEVAKFIEDLGFTIDRGNRHIIYPKELDIVIPDKKIAIEFCGLYWHTERRGKYKTYHLEKLEKCIENGYRLITIFEDEWMNKNEIVKSRLRYIFGIYDTTIFARKCSVSTITTEEASNFINLYHIQGYTKGNVKLGLFYDTELVAVMTFSKGNIAKGSKSIDNVYELDRFCSSCKVIGGAGKLLKFFQRNYEWKSIFSYADLRWSDGKLYKSLGFDFVHSSSPNYWYVIGVFKRSHRFNYRKSVLPQKLDIFSPDKTEYENMSDNGYDRIWDCGNMKFIINK